MRQHFLLLVGLILILNGCTNIDARDIAPRFSFGTKVYVTYGFYNGCKGNIFDYYGGNRITHYDIEAECPYKGHTFTQSKTLNRINEEYLVQDSSD
jgi:hypothetical protein